MSGQHRTTLVVCILFLILAFHISVAWKDVATLSRNGFLYDDSFYAFKIAENIAAGRGITFDGVHSTTGFQPLYVFLLVPAFLVCGDNLVMPIYIALSLLAVFTCLTAYLIYRISKRYVSWVASIIAAVGWAFSPIVAKQSANGLETALASFMIAVCILYYLEKLRSVENPSRSRFMVLGILLGLAILARIDGILLLLVMLLDYLVLLRRRRVSSKPVAHVFLLLLGALILYSPWLIFNLTENGSPLQDSGAATRFLSLAYASYFGVGMDNLASRGPDVSFIWAHVNHSISTMKVIPPVHVLFRATERLDTVLGSHGILHTTGNVIGFLLLMGVGLAVMRWGRDARRASRRELDFLLLFSGVLLASYTMYIFGMFFFLRYFYPVYLIACIYSAFFLQDILDWCSRRSCSIRWGVISMAAAYTILFSYFSYSQTFRSHPIYPYYDIARWVDANTREDERIGVFQCGTIGYFSHRQIINLDGKVNREALVAMKNGCLERYLQEERIDIVLDHSRILEIILGYSPKKIRGSCTDVVLESMDAPSGWIAYRRSALTQTTDGDSGADWADALLPLRPLGK